MHVVLNSHKLFVDLEAPAVVLHCLLQVRISCVSESKGEEKRTGH